MVAYTYTAVLGGGNWNANATWSSGDGGTTFPVAGDTANINATIGAGNTVTINVASACAVLNLTSNAGTLAFGTQVLTVTGNVTLGGTVTTGSTGALTITGASTLNSGGVTFPALLNLNYTGTVTLGGGNNWINTKLVTTNNATVLSKTTAETMTLNGGMALSGAISGTADLIWGGGTWTSISASRTISNNLTITGAVATCVVSGIVYYSLGVLTYTSGTVTVTNSTLNLQGATTHATNGMSWNNIIFITGTQTLSNNLTANGLITNTGSGTFNGNTMICNGGFTGTAQTGGTTTIQLSGGNVSTSNYYDNPITVAGNITIVSTSFFRNNTFTYVSGTVSGTGYISFLTETINIGVVAGTLPLVYLANSTSALTSNFYATTIESRAASSVITGEFDIYCANFRLYSAATASTGFTFTKSQTLNVSNSISIAGNYLVSPFIKSSLGGTAFNLTYTGTAADTKVFMATFTDVNASVNIDNWYGIASTGDTNISIRTSADIGGAAANIFGMIG